MRKLLCMVALGACATFVSCAGPEPTGLTANVAASSSKQVVVSPARRPWIQDRRNSSRRSCCRRQTKKGRVHVSSSAPAWRPSLPRAS